MANDYYKTLGVERSASQDEIAKAYRKLARKYHPDLNPDDQSAKKQFLEIQNAYDTLNDPEKRKKYDQFGDAYEKYGDGKPFGGGGWSGGGGGSSGFDFGDVFGGGSGAGAVDLGDIFRQFGGGGAANPRSRRGAAPRGHDIAAEIEVPLRTLVVGGEMQFQLQRESKVESIRVKVPAGIEPGKKIRLRGQGGAMPGGKPGDLLLTIRLQPHPAIKLVGHNIELRLPIQLFEAINGAKIDVPTIKGTATLTIPPMSNSGQRLRIKGQGFPNASGPAGDLLVELQIRLPPSIPAATRESIEAISSSYPSDFRDAIQW